MRRRQLLASLAAFAAAAALTGCGGDDDGSDGDSTDTATTATVEGEGRLSESSWTAYEQALGEAQAVNQQAITAMRKCQNLPLGTEPAVVGECVEKAGAPVVREGEQFEATLAGFHDEAGGECATQLTNLEGYVKLYLASVNGLVESVQGGSQQAIEETQSALARTRAEAQAFEQACKPA